MQDWAQLTTLPVPPPGSHADKAVGCLVAALAGDALGAAVEGRTAQRIREAFPSGLTSFQDCRLGLGCYTDDGQMLLALAASLVNQGGRCVASDATTQYAQAYDPERGYGGGAGRILARLQAQLAAGPLPPTLGTELLAQGGSYGNGGAMRIAPLGLALRNAPPAALDAAVRAALIPTHHVHPLAHEGALCQALAVAELAKLGQPGPCSSSSSLQAPAAGGHSGGQGSSGEGTASAAASPGRAAASGIGGCGSGMPPPGALQLLDALRDKLEGRSQVMSARLGVMEAALQQLYGSPDLLGPKRGDQDWRAYFASPAWALEVHTAAEVAPGEPAGQPGGPQGFQIKGSDAAAAALWACLAHWHEPADAVVAAVHYGGDTDTIACMTGALVGALHGCAWLPDSWWTNLERGATTGTAHFNMPAVHQALRGLEDAVADTREGTTAAAGSEGALPQPDDRQPQPAHCDPQQRQQQQAHNLCGADAPAGPPVLVHTTRDMGRDGAVLLARLLARLDVRH